MDTLILILAIFLLGIAIVLLSMVRGLLQTTIDQLKRIEEIEQEIKELVEEEDDEEDGADWWKKEEEDS